MTYQIKLASYQDIQKMLDWAKEEGWDPGLRDALPFQIIDPSGFFMGYLDNEPISCISNVQYSKDYSFLGFYIVKPAYRKKGFGLTIWEHAIRYGLNCNSGLDGVVAQQANYKKSGFQLAHNNIRHEFNNTLSAFKHPNIIPAYSLPLLSILNYDKNFFPCSRQAFLTSWLIMDNAQSLVYLDKEICGYGVIRRCVKGYKIAPLFADSRAIATDLFKALCSTVQDNQPIFLDTPEINSEALLLAQDFSMKPVFETARMYSKFIPDISINRTFGITTFEVG